MAVTPVEAFPASDVAHRRARPPVGITVVTVLSLACYLSYSLSRYSTYLTTGYDLGIFDQAVRMYAHFHAPVVALKGPDYNIFGDHFHPMIATLAPFYWLWDDARVLLIAQSALLAASIPVVYRFTLRRGSRTFALVVAAAYAAGWPIQSMIDFEFHEVAFAMPLVALAVDALDRRDTRGLLIWSLPLLAVREDMGFLLVILGLLHLVRTKPAGWRGLVRRPPPASVVVLVAAGVVAYELTTALVIPAFSPGGKFAYWQYDAIGDNLTSALTGIITRPWHAIAVFLTPAVKAQTLAYLFLPLALLPLRSPYVLLSAPLLAERFFNSRENLWTTHFHYNALPWLILVLAMVDGAGRLGLLNRSRPARPLLAALTVWLVAVPIYLASPANSVTPNPVGRMVNGAWWRVSERVSSQQAATAFIPARTCVEVDDRLAPHLASRNFVSLPPMQNWTADFIALDMSVDDVGNIGPTPQSILDAAIAHGYQVVFSQAAIIVLRSPGYTGPSAACSPFGGGH